MAVGLRLILGSLPVMLLPLIAGCGGGAGTASVTGNVTYDGKPLGSGVVAFVFKNSAGLEVRETGQIQPDGSYSISRLSPGQVTIIVETIPPVDLPKERKQKDMPDLPPIGGGDAPKGTFVKIPDKYKDPATSGLTYTVKSGKQKYNIELPK